MTPGRVFVPEHHPWRIECGPFCRCIIYIAVDRDERVIDEESRRPNGIR